jgi:Ca2+-binding RTX toxin-like protein
MPAHTSHDHRIRPAGRAAASIVATAAFVFGPGVASAAVVSSDGTTVTFQANPGETNVVTVDETATDYRFNDTGAGLTAGAGCTQVNANTADCPKAAPVSVVMNMGDMDDDLGTPFGPTPDEDPFTINGSEGADELRGTAAGDTVNGGDGNDQLLGQPGNDTVNGGNDNDYLFGGLDDDDLHGNLGNDRLEGWAGADAFDGDAGIDRALYGGSENPCQQAITVTINNVADDTGCRVTSGPDIGDNVTNTIESVTGSQFADTIRGSCFANTFAGDPGVASGDPGGNDDLRGDPVSGCTPGSSDFLGGGEGSDTLFGDAAAGTPGIDTVTYGLPYTGVGDLNIAINGGAVSNDGWGNTTETIGGTIERVIGNSGNDTLNATAAEQAVQLFGRLGNDTLTDSPFDDLLDGEAGTDTINCPNGGTDSYRGAEVVNTPVSCEVGL